jgi:hypothetical protein
MPAPRWSLHGLPRRCRPDHQITLEETYTVNHQGKKDQWDENRQRALLVAVPFNPAATYSLFFLELVPPPFVDGSRGDAIKPC